MAWCTCCGKDEGNLEVLQPKEVPNASPGFNGSAVRAVGARGALRAPIPVPAASEEAHPADARTPVSSVEAADKKELDDAPEAVTPDKREIDDAPQAVAVAPDKQDIDDAPEAVAAGPEAWLVKVVQGTPFQVEVLKESGKIECKMCVDINFHDGATLLLTKVNAGPVVDHNLANPTLEVAPGDRIVVINGVTNDAQAMLGECKTAPKLDMTMQRCAERTLTFHKKAALADLGLEVAKVDAMSLLVAKVLPEGWLHQHNQSQPEHAVQPEDRIVAINGVRSDGAGLLERLATAELLELTARRIWPDGVRLSNGVMTTTPTADGVTTTTPQQR